MSQLKWAVAAATAAAILMSAIPLQPAAVAQTNYRATVPKGCPAGAVLKPQCRAPYQARCIRWARQCKGHPWKHCLEYACAGRELNPQVRQPFKGPKPLPGSRRR
jgi:hypothetical protein